MMIARGNYVTVPPCLAMVGFLLALLACTDAPVQPVPIADGPPPAISDEASADATPPAAEGKPNLTYWYMPG